MGGIVKGISILVMYQFEFSRNKKAARRPPENH
jgi:hypothetical protein